MDRVWMQIPGPRRFLSGIVQDIEDGKNVILCLPEHIPDGLANAVRSELGSNRDWRTISLGDESIASKPLDMLFQRFVQEDISPERDPDKYNILTLAEHKDFAGKIIWLDEIDPSLWENWKEFLINYQQPCRAIPERDRTIFCVPLRGELALDPPSEDVCLSQRTWKEVVDRIDMLLFTANLFRQKSLPDLHKRVVIYVVAHLALWDFQTSEYFLDEKLDYILNPVPILKKIAKERNWYNYNSDKDDQENWCRGLADKIEGESKIHSAALAIKKNEENRGEEINRRIWSAEVGILLPFVEELRLPIIDKLKSYLEVPHQAYGGYYIEDVRKLEIGHINYQIYKKNVDEDIKEIVNTLYAIRNKLAHIELIRPRDIKREQINNWRDYLLPHSDKLIY